jgi:tetratricopeptide (TPR) repeat protein
MMRTPRYAHCLYSLLCIGGMLCVAFALQQYRYAHFISTGNRAVAEKRFDTQEYVYASRAWFARQDKLLFNQGVLAYRAGNVPRAADYFQRASQHAESVMLRTQTLYNLSVAMLAEKEVEGAAELLKETLRLDPRDKDAKLMLERLYALVPHQQGTYGEATHEQAPGLGPEQEDGTNGKGQGRSKPAPNI